MLWTVSEKFVEQGSRKSYIFAACVCAVAFVFGLFPFSDLIGFIYTILGYTGLIFNGCVIYKRFARKDKTKVQ